MIKYSSLTAASIFGCYAFLLALLTTQSFQAHVVYLHKLQMTWSKDLNIPESFGFLRNQVTPFSIPTRDGKTLYAWHILPIELYRQHESTLIDEPSGFVKDVTSRFAFNLFHHDPDARLVIHMHGAAGTVGSGYRVPNYLALSAGQPDKIHVLTFDYRGFGRSPGTPSESGLVLDAIAVVDWAIKIGGISPARIIVFGQSLGTAVSLALLEHFAMQSPPVLFAGGILVAPFVDVASLVATYRLAGTIPILSPLSSFPLLFNYLSTFIQDKWSSKNRIEAYVRANQANGQRYWLTLIHAEDDYDIPWHHTETLFWHAVNATTPKRIDHDQFVDAKDVSSKHLGAAGSIMESRTKNGVIRKEILKTGLHDVIMGNPVITLAVMRIFESANLAS